MKRIGKNNEYRLIKITYEKPVNGGVEKREIILTGYHGLVLITMTILITGMVLVLSGVKIF